MLVGMVESITYSTVLHCISGGEGAVPHPRVLRRGSGMVFDDWGGGNFIE